VFIGFSLCARACVQNIYKSYEQILTKFCGKAERDTGRNRLDFGGDSDSFVDPE